MEEKSLFKQLEKELKSLEEVYWIISETELEIRLAVIKQLKIKLKKEFNYTDKQLNQFDF